MCAAIQPSLDDLVPIDQPSTSLEASHRPSCASPARRHAGLCDLTARRSLLAGKYDSYVDDDGPSTGRPVRPSSVMFDPLRTVTRPASARVLVWTKSSSYGWAVHVA
jgi:hypothetical protein